MPQGAESEKSRLKYPHYDARASQWTWSAESLKRQFRLFPLGENFINWTASQGFMVVETELDGLGYVVSPARMIFVKKDLPEEEKNLTIVQELIHIVVPSIHSKHTKPELEKAIDEIATHYAQNPRFMNLVRERIPSYCSLPDLKGLDLRSREQRLDKRYDIRIIDPLG